jgi:hypothetical protein
MKLLRSITRRGFDVSSAGWFTVLRPNTWFAASRLRTTRPRAAAHPHRLIQTAPTLSVKLNANDPSFGRLAFALVLALAITTVLLLWIMYPNIVPPR